MMCTGVTGTARQWGGVRDGVDKIITLNLYLLGESLVVYRIKHTIMLIYNILMRVIYIKY